jgi:hypothetical protein
VSDLERRYRRILALYPRDHRERTGEEMLGVLMAGTGDRSRPGWRETADLLWAAARLHLRRVVAADGGIDPRDVLAIVSLLAPVALLAGATTGLHELAWWVKAGALWEMPWSTQFPDAPVWVVWCAVAVLGLFRLRHIAAVSAWLGTAGFVIVVTVGPAPYPWTGVGAGWVLLGAITAAALTWSPGPARGRELVGRHAIAVLAAAVAVTVASGVLGYGESVAQWLGLAMLFFGAVAACGPRSRAGRRAALVLVVPVMTALLGKAFLSSATDAVSLVRAPDAVVATVFYGVPVVVLLALGGLPRRIGRRRGGPVT